MTVVWNGVRSKGSLGSRAGKRLAQLAPDRARTVLLGWDDVAGVAMDRAPGPLSVVAPKSRLRGEIRELASGVVGEVVRAGGAVA